MHNSSCAMADCYCDSLIGNDSIRTIRMPQSAGWRKDKISVLRSQWHLQTSCTQPEQRCWSQPVFRRAASQKIAGRQRKAAAHFDVKASEIPRSQTDSSRASILRHLVYQQKAELRSSNIFETTTWQCLSQGVC